MRTNVEIRSGSGPFVEGPVNWIKKYVLLRSHPRAVIVEAVGIVWTLYFLWMRDWRLAITAFVISRIISLGSTFNEDISKLTHSVLGKFALLHLNPFNFLIQMFGVVFLIFGVWNHIEETILVGISFVLLGNLFGWGEFDSN